MSLAWDVQNTLPGLRAQAEGLMVDACTITGPVTKEWDEDTSSYTETRPTIYEGACRVRVATLQPLDVTVQGQALVQDDYVLSIPVDAAGSGSVGKGHQVTVTACRNDPSLVGIQFQILAEHHMTFATARRFPIQQVEE